MHSQFPAAVSSINILMAAGFKLPLLPEWRTNSGWTIKFTDVDVVGKVGLVMSRGYDYALLVGVIQDGIFIETEEEASNEHTLDMFYEQFDNYLTRVVAMFKPHGDETELTREKLRQIQNDIIEGAWGSVSPYYIEHNEKLYLEGRRVTAEIRRKPGGNGVISVTHDSGDYFYIQFEQGNVRAFNTKGYTREFVLTHLGGILDTIPR